MIRKLIVLLASLFIGMALNIPNNNDKEIITQDKLKEFEDNIIIKEKDYHKINNNIKKTPFNKIGIKIEKIIDQGFDLCFDIIKEVINDE